MSKGSRRVVIDTDGAEDKTVPDPPKTGNVTKTGNAPKTGVGAKAGDKLQLNEGPNLDGTELGRDRSWTISRRG